MKIKELLQLLQQSNIKTVRTNLDISEKRFTAGMANAGYNYSQKAKSWLYIGQGAEPLNQEFEDFLPPLQRQKKADAIDDSSNASIEKTKRNPTTNIRNQVDSINELDAIDKLLLQNDSNSEQRVYRGFYWDKDIIHFLDNVKHGNKSDLMNEIVRAILKTKGLI